MPPFRDGRSRNWGVIVCCLLFLLASLVLIDDPASAAKPKAKREKATTATPSATSGEQSLTNIPLPIGHEAKGLVLPDFDLEGHLRGRFEAESAKRLDEVHIGFHTLKITTYTPENEPDLTIELSESILNLKTRILSSKERSTIKRTDFNIVGDSVEFDTNTRTGKLVGNVKMVITSQSQLLKNQNE
jgi:lipopolysaccharide assembly outer membrane protein LptD (OstA)